MRLFCPKKDGQLWLRLMGRSVDEAKKRLVNDLSWSNCFDMMFKPTKEELSEYKIVEVEIIEKIL